MLAHFQSKIKCLGYCSALLLMLIGCTTVTNPPERFAVTKALWQENHFTSIELPQDGLTLYSAVRITDPSKSTHLYIEGDGFAFISAAQISPDPTPLKPMLAALAAADPAPNVIYLGRPCQYLKAKSPRCNTHWWTDQRFTAEHNAALGIAIDNLKQRYGLTAFELIGYSGGGFHAAALAGIRSDVIKLRTIAGNLDLKTFVAEHDHPPFTAPLGLKSYAEKLEKIPQEHLIGGEDKIVPASIYNAYAKSLNSACVHAVTVPDTSHYGPWDQAWKTALARPLPAC